MDETLRAILSELVKLIPVSRGDLVRVTYTVLPTLTFFKQ